MWHKIKTVAEDYGLDPEKADAFAREHHERFKIINHDCQFPMVNTFEHDHFLKEFRQFIAEETAKTEV